MNEQSFSFSSHACWQHNKRGVILMYITHIQKMFYGNLITTLASQAVLPVVECKLTVAFACSIGSCWHLLCLPMASKAGARWWQWVIDSSALRSCWTEVTLFACTSLSLLTRLLPAQLSLTQPSRAMNTRHRMKSMQTLHLCISLGTYFRAYID